MHHRCSHRIYVTKTIAQQISNTVKFFPRHCNMLYPSSVDKATIAAKELVHVLTHPLPSLAFKCTDPIIQQLKQLATIFQQATNTNEKDLNPDPILTPSRQQKQQLKTYTHLQGCQRSQRHTTNHHQGWTLLKRSNNLQGWKLQLRVNLKHQNSIQEGQYIGIQLDIN